MDPHRSLANAELYRGLGVVILPKEITQNELYDYQMTRLQPIITSHSTSKIEDEGSITRRASLRERWTQIIKEREQANEQSTWSTSSEGSNYSTQSSESEESDWGTPEERFAKWREFFDNGPLMRCLDTDEERESLNNLLYEKLMTEVKEPNPVKYTSFEYRGLVQIRVFWADIRKELNVDDDNEGEEEYWLDGYPGSP